MCNCDGGISELLERGDVVVGGCAIDVLEQDIEPPRQVRARSIEFKVIDHVLPHEQFWNMNQDFRTAGKPREQICKRS